MSTNNTEINSFSGRLRSCLKKLNLSQQAFADKLGTAQGTVSGWLNRGSIPRGGLLTQIADILEVHSAWLVYGTGPMEIDNSPHSTEAQPGPAAEFSISEGGPPLPFTATIRRLSGSFVDMPRGSVLLFLGNVLRNPEHDLSHGSYMRGLLAEGVDYLTELEGKD